MGPLTLITFIPAVGAALVAVLPRDNHRLIRWTSLVVTFIVLVIAVSLYPQFNREAVGINQESSFQFVDKGAWIPAFNINYFVGVDGLSFPMVLLTALLCFLCVPASFGIKKGIKGYFAMFLLLETGMMGTFVALDFFLFYVFWELMLLPMYFLIGVWGGPRRIYAAIKFFIYTLVGSVLMLIVILVFYFNTRDPVTGGHTFNMLHMMSQANQSGLLSVWTWRVLLFFGLYIGFAIKIPAFPFHTWLPDAHVEAPTAISVILAGILLKMGTYGLLRITYPMLTDATVHFAWFIALIGVVNIIYGAFCAMAQKDLKKLIAYSSISHMGFVMLGMASFTKAGMMGAVFQMFNHGTITAMLFLLVGVNIRPRASPPDRRFRRIGERYAALLGDNVTGVFRGDGAAGALGVHFRGDVFHRCVHGFPDVNHHLGVRHHHNGGIYALDVTTHVLWEDQPEI